MEKLPHYYFLWLSLFSKNTDKWEMLPLETEQYGGKLLLHSDIRGECFWRTVRIRRGKETREATGILRKISKRSVNTEEETCACFTGWQKAFFYISFYCTTSLITDYKYT